MAEGVKEGFYGFQVGRLELFAEQRPGEARGGARAAPGIIPEAAGHKPALSGLAGIDDTSPSGSKPSAAAR